MALALQLSDVGICYKSDFIFVNSKPSGAILNQSGDFAMVIVWILHG